VRLGCVLPVLWLTVSTFGEEDSREAERRFRFLLARSEELEAQSDALDPDASRAEMARLEGLRRRLENDYRHFLSDHPRHARAMVAYGSLLYDHGREEEGVRWWEKAIAVDPREAYAYNNIANHYGHSGRAAEALKLYDKAIALEPAEPVFRFNWATTCVTLREAAHAVYGWTTDEIYRRCLEQFRKARELAPQEFELANAYAQTFYGMPRPDWTEAYRAWKFCLGQPLTDAQRQFVCANLARVSVELGRYNEARQWAGKITDGRQNGVRRGLERRIAARSKALVPPSETNAPTAGADAAGGKGPSPSPPRQ
jgi:tetratricopeptide (TPR) repeat protein